MMMNERIKTEDLVLCVVYFTYFIELNNVYALSSSSLSSLSNDRLRRGKREDESTSFPFLFFSFSSSRDM